MEAIVEEAEDERPDGFLPRGGGGREEALVADLDPAMRRGLCPLVPVCAARGVGLAAAGPRGDRSPAPADAPSPEVFTPAGKAAPPDHRGPHGPLVAEVVRTTSDPYVGRLSMVRVFSGTLRPDQQLHVSGHASSFFGAATGHEDHDTDERTGALSHPFGAALVPAAELVAGDIGCVSRLTTAETGDTLSTPEEPRVLKPWAVPTPSCPWPWRPPRARTRTSSPVR